MSDKVKVKRKTHSTFQVYCGESGCLIRNVGNGTRGRTFGEQKRTRELNSTNFNFFLFLSIAITYNDLIDCDRINYKPIFPTTVYK